MKRELSDAVVVITGASSGIGRAAALAFARRGAMVVVAARREGPIEELANECRRLGAGGAATPACTPRGPRQHCLGRQRRGLPVLQRLRRLEVGGARILQRAPSG